MDKEKFTGAWKLISTDYRTEEGEVIYPFGEEVIGQLMYDGKRSMAAQVIKARRPNFASNDWLKGTPEEIKAAFEGFRSYFGTYDVDEEKKMVTHHIQGSSFPNWMTGGVDNVRYYEFSGNRLTLRTAPLLMGGKNVIGRLVWERL
jgi:hypothetical protein